MTHNLGMPPYRLPGPGGLCPPDFKQPPTEQIPSAPSNPKKRRKTSNANSGAAAAAAAAAAANQLSSQSTPTPQDLLPPPLTGYGDTIIASNPFDDTPPPSAPSMSHHPSMMGHMSGPMGHPHHPSHHPPQHMHPHHMGGPLPPQMRGGGMVNPLGLGNPMSHGPMGGPGHMGGHHPGMQCGPIPPHMARGGGMGPMGGPMNHPMGVGPGMPPGGPGGMSGMSPMGGGPGSLGPSISPMSGMSPMSNSGPPNSHLGSTGNSIGMNPSSLGGPHPNGQRSISSPMSSGGPIGSPMNSLPMGSPMSSGGGAGSVGSNTIGSPLGGQNQPQQLNNGPMGPPMHSPLGNGPQQQQQNSGGGGPSPHSHMPPNSRMNIHNGAMGLGPGGMGPSINSGNNLGRGGPSPGLTMQQQHQLNQMSCSNNLMQQQNSMNSIGGNCPTSIGPNIPPGNSPIMNHQNVPMNQIGPGNPSGNLSGPSMGSVNSNNNNPMANMLGGPMNPANMSPHHGMSMNSGGPGGMPGNASGMGGMMGGGGGLQHSHLGHMSHHMVGPGGPGGSGPPHGGPQSISGGLPPGLNHPMNVSGLGGNMGGMGGMGMGGPMGMFGGPKPMPVSSGKMYPPGQPMVFNPQNPNAPPIYPCGMCHKEINDNDEAVFCESGCNFFFHRTCAGMTEGAFVMIHREIYAEWCCDKCLNSSLKTIPMVKFKC